LLLLKCGLTAPKIAEIGNFWYKFAQKGYTPLSDFYKIWVGEGQKCGLKPPKSQKLVIFGIYFPQRGIALIQFLQNLAWGRVSHVPTIMPTFTFVALKMWPYGRQNCPK